MKKISKKQRLIIAISIVLLLIILAIIYTSNIISKNSNLKNGGYLATTANANSNLVASYIKEGITIGGITGTLETLDTSDATATAADIEWGKTAYVDGVKITGTYDNSTLAQLKKSGQAVTENMTVQDKYNNSIKIPAGFKIAEDSSTDVTGGVVIEDVSAGDENTKGSQFVWIPVGDVITDSNGSTTKIELGRYTFDSNGTPSPDLVSDVYREDTAESHNSRYANTIAKDIEDFKDKANTSHGYYIGRFEAGDALATVERTNSSTADNPVVCKKGIYPYNCVKQSQASSLCQEMYTNSNFESDLINSYAWDTAIVFIQTFSGDTDYSKQIRLQGSLARCGEATDGTNYDIRCNIYDMSGNTSEWSTETSLTEWMFPCVSRGGNYDNTNRDTSYRSRTDFSDDQR